MNKRVGMRNAWHLTRDILYLGDSSMLRLLMGAASIFYGADLLLDSSTFERPIYRLMLVAGEAVVPALHAAAWLSPQGVWGIAFLFYGACALWRIYEGTPRRWWGVAVNVTGFGVWSVSALAMTLSLGRFPLPMVVQSILSLQLLVIAIRTGLNDDITTP